VHEHQSQQATQQLLLAVQQQQQAWVVTAMRQSQAASAHMAVGLQMQDSQVPRLVGMQQQQLIGGLAMRLGKICFSVMT
jgi:hypothetical protein